MPITSAFAYNGFFFFCLDQVTNRIKVTDIHEVTPSSFVEFSASSIHALSYQQARNHGVNTGQVYVAEPGYILVSMPSISLSVSIHSETTWNPQDTNTFQRSLKLSTALVPGFVVSLFSLVRFGPPVSCLVEHHKQVEICTILKKRICLEYGPSKPRLIYYFMCL